ncbi:18255_t:CDS:1 [Acaulospora morrowiae]|uniref:18255_t:CDS:1 n=1 Tax=Acaulospora morrowiae TaxID=94023 RepID=A0A9N9AEL0_9GLOM|nr:18255_t:CDS:1 [Acaulospora morrowiae]
MSQLRSDILSKRNHNEVEKTKQQYKQIHIATPIQPFNDNKDMIQKELIESFLLISDNEANSPNNSVQLIKTTNEDIIETINEDIIKTTNKDMIKIINKDVVNDIEEYWSHMIESLISTLNNENRLDNNEIIDSQLLEFELGGCIIHLVDNPLEKWSLLKLFNDLLEASVSFVP